MQIQKPRGTYDLLPGEIELWQAFEKNVRRHFHVAHYTEIRTPIFEHTELFVRGVGETTDIVEKEMYNFVDRGNRSLTLRPEGTAGVVRAYVENKRYGKVDLDKLYYLGPMFRYERPQGGRTRQFYQYGCEVLGSNAPELDAEVVQLSYRILADFGLQHLQVELNSVGCSVCRPLHRDEMLALVLPRQEEFCSDCQRRMEKNPLRMFDCKHENCQRLLTELQVPSIAERLCAECAEHFTTVQEHLTAMSVPYQLNGKLVRGLDYYTRTAWEVTTEGSSTLAGGGRYNGLIKELGGPDIPGIGFAGGMERVIQLAVEQQVYVPVSDSIDVYVAVADASASLPATELVADLRAEGIATERDFNGKSLKSQLKTADRLHAQWVLLLGEQEVAKGVVGMKSLASGEQMDVPADKVVATIINSLKKERASQ